MRFFILFFFIILSLNLYSKEHYNLIKLSNKQYINKEFTFNVPLIYISGLKQCNHLNKKLALNSECLLINKSKYKLSKLNTQCEYCSFQRKNNKHLFKIEVNYNPNFTVVEEYNVDINHFSYQLLGSNIEKVLLLKDNKGNYVETSVSFIKSIKHTLSNEEKQLLSLKNKTISKQFCFNSKNQNRYDKLNNLISDLNLNINITKNKCDNLGLRNGFLLETLNFNHFLTFEMFKEDYYINGKWIN